MIHHMGTGEAMVNRDEIHIIILLVTTRSVARPGECDQYSSHELDMDTRQAIPIVTIDKMSNT